MKAKNKLIVFEGIDGVGKTTLARRVAAMLEKHNIPVRLYESYENKKHGFNALKSFIKHTPIEASHLFYLASAVYKSSILRDLLQHSWVICDRYVYSTDAYHIANGSTIRMSMEELGILKPDHAFLITVKEEIRMARIRKKRGKTKSDSVPNVYGHLPYKKERVFEKMGLKRINNSGATSQAVSLIFNIIMG